MRNIVEKIIKDNARVKIMYCRNYGTYKVAASSVERTFKDLKGINYLVVKIPHGRHTGRWVPVLIAAIDMQEQRDYSQDS